MTSCSHTGTTKKSWWRLILPAMYRITSVSITNRIDVPERINNAMILIGNCPMNNGNNNPICAVIPSIPSGSTRTFNCGGMIGRFVNVYLNSEYLTICELEVYGELVTPSPSFGAVVMGRKVVVVEKKLSWSDAVLYCRDFYWDLLSIRSEEEQVEVGEVLSSASFPLTKHVWLGLRRYLMDGRWFWMSGPSVDYSSWETDHIWRVTSPCGGIDTSGHFHWNDLPCGDHLHFICLTVSPLIHYLSAELLQFRFHRSAPPPILYHFPDTAATPPEARDNYSKTSSSTTSWTFSA
ncbi:uncharacterized protein LOC130204209 [Pseudoliparis swirei]|uniref:uncharacterized protein LOC130204209 n=1 Tax=Pseudoliparis swirei TaxID=2059687 RepID=UPI0024BDB563|nr:uncharacterized protein LOC130204209 [Pseudoliparis swirei]